MAKQTENLMDGVREERDRLVKIKQDLIDDGSWDLPNFFFYRYQVDNMVERANDAIGGRLDVVEIVRLLKEMQEFEV